ncbi:Uma2 family endonuclease [Botrimarina sp.]|uniref:Uma2 family endonuclease n=1 Tax=Botrimarina sp. TaxID=2795802 RepID=UPI0032ECAF89
MTQHPSLPADLSNPGDYAWEIATRFPTQGHWSESDYFALLDQAGSKGFELVDGRIEVLPLPTRIHQLLGKFLFLALNAFVESAGLGEVHYSGLRFRVRNGRIREPDVIFLSASRMHLARNKAFDGADLCIEVVSGSAEDRQRDYVDKATDYSSRGVAEYWIVDPDERHVIVNRLEGQRYVEHGRFREGDSAASVLLDGFSVDVGELFAVIEGVEG